MKKFSKMKKSELLMELGRWMKRVEDQQKLISELRKQNEAAKSGVSELGRVVDAILIEATRKFGVEVGDGVFEAVIPRPKIEDNPTHVLATERDEEKDTYTLRVVPVKKEKK